MANRVDRFAPTLIRNPTRRRRFARNLPLEVEQVHSVELWPAGSFPYHPILFQAPRSVHAVARAFQQGRLPFPHLPASARLTALPVCPVRSLVSPASLLQLAVQNIP